MAWYTVSYDLRKELSRGAWTKMDTALRSAVDWCKPLETFYIVETTLTPSQIIAALLRVGALDDNDGIVVLEITLRGDFRRLAGEDRVEWMRSHIDRF
jgi:hypothetical protein